MIAFISILALCTMPRTEPAGHPDRSAVNEMSVGESDRAQPEVTVRQGAVLHTSSRQWTFTPSTEGRGLDVRCEFGGATSTFRLESGDHLGQVTRVVTAYLAWDKREFIGLGVEFVNNGAYGYAMIEGGNLGAPITDPDGWVLVPISLGRELARPIDLMAVALPGGDSLVMTLTDLGATAEGGVERFTIAHHCPLPVGSKWTRGQMGIAFPPEVCHETVRCDAVERFRPQP
jgi:hypothetical protein